MSDQHEAIERLRSALEPFVRAFEGRKAAYVRRHADPAVGEANFDAMPDDWPIDGTAFSMGVYRRACEAVRTPPDVVEREASGGVERMREALEKIARLRPAGDVDTCKAPRKLVEQMEIIALATLSAKTDGDDVSGFGNHEAVRSLAEQHDSFLKPNIPQSYIEAMEAARLLEASEDANANCPECDGDDIPERCERCFPLFDEARLRRRRALALAGLLTNDFANCIAPLAALKSDAVPPLPEAGKGYTPVARPQSAEGLVGAALAKWRALPDDERNGERPFIMGFNAGWEEAGEHGAAALPKHQYWAPGEADCPRDIKAGNGEIHTLRCKVCGLDNPRDDRCLASAAPTTPASPVVERGGQADDTRAALRMAIMHLEHQAAWIGKTPNGYSFEALGEDMPGIKDALARLSAPVPETHVLDALERIAALWPNGSDAMKMPIDTARTMAGIARGALAAAPGLSE